MTRPLIVLRPEPGSAETIAAARARGLVAIASPLFTIEPVPWQAPDPAAFDGILVGSANVFRHGGGGLSALADLPIYAVGERTARAARAAGFSVAGEGSSDLQDLLGTLQPPQRLLRLAGEVHVSVTPPPGIAIAERIVYRARPQALRPDAARCLGGGAVVLLHSGAAAQAFAAECDRLNLDRSVIAIAALAPRIAQCAGSPWSDVQVAPEVTDAALLALANDMCQ